MIPRILHQIWVGPDPYPDEFARYTKTWQRHHPDWELRMWTEETIPRDLRRPEVLERLRVPAERSDILRLELLWREGGVYLDTDFECQKPLDPLIEGLDFFLAYLKPGRTNNAIIGAVPGHPILDRALDEIRPREFHGHDKRGTGPLFLDALIKQYPDVRIFDPPVFYPSTLAEREDAVAIHHMARSWKDAEQFRKTAVRAEERLAKTQEQLRRTERDLDAARKQIAALKAGRRGSSLAPLRRLAQAVSDRRR